jgi:PPM family protein phosphatase
VIRTGDEDEPVDRMSIGDFARATGLTPKALRLYDEMGLVRPAQVDEYSGYRYYDPGQLEPARTVARLRRIGLPLDRIRSLAGMPSGAAAAELMSYWRQVEADTSSRRAMVAVLVEELRSVEDDMVISDIDGPAVVHRSGKGARDTQLDAVLTGARVFAVADGFGRDPELPRRVLGHWLRSTPRRARSMPCGCSTTPSPPRPRSCPASRSSTRRRPAAP